METAIEGLTQGLNLRFYSFRLGDRVDLVHGQSLEGVRLRQASDKQRSIQSSPIGVWGLGMLINRKV